MPPKLPWPEITVTALVIAAGGAVYAYAHRNDSALEQSKRRGEQLVEALHTYEREHGDYPDQLDELVPKHVATIEQPTWGQQRWRYRRYTRAEAVGRTEEPAATRSGAGIDAAPAVDSAQEGESPRESESAQLGESAEEGESAQLGESAQEGESAHRAYFQLSVAADESGYPVLYYDFATRRWVLNN